ncbi:MAG: restriction endonuclease subunit S [Candidimonas sp.]|nr:restriction endonuclease subunit S [Candidimonas sp.]
MSFSLYPSYKDSGVEWLGEVPEHWKIGRLKNIAKIRSGRDYKDVETEDEEAIPVIGSGGPFTYATEHLFDGESVLLGRKGTVDNPLYIKGRFWTVDTMFYTEIDSRAVPKFVYYLATVIPFSYYSTSTALPSMSQFDLSNHRIVFPGMIEQKQIARFLGHETAKIDALIEEQQRLIELLKEKRQAVISHAVTKGLDPSVPMKDSGVEWLGEVPAHWALAPLKYLAVLNPRKSGFSGDTGLLCSFVPMEKLKTGALLLDEDRPTEEVFGGYTYFENGDILQAKVTPCFENKNIALAKGLTNGVGFGSSEINVIRPGQELDAQYLFYRMQEDAYMSICASSMIGAGGLKRVPTDVINNFVVAIPAVAEQLTIASYIDSCLADLDVLAATALESVRLLQERRSALISAAVTGKIDVRDWHPPKSLSYEPHPEDKSCLETI